jgi:hypothetical protein
MKILYILILLFSFQFGWAQGNPFSQEKAEANALQKYEKEHPPVPTMAMPAPAVNEAFFGARLIRSATLLATSCKEHSYPVKVLIYGQSITGSKSFTEQISAYLKEKYPYADLTVENRSIGGFSGDRLLRTAVHDVYSSCADLIIFHVYGGEAHGELEQLFTNIRRYTTADVILMNHHLDGNQKTFNPASYQYLRYIAGKYSLEQVDITTEWIKYIADNNLNQKDLLRDNVHPNPNGNWLMAQLIGRHIKYNPLFPSPWLNMVQTCFAKFAYDVNGIMPLVFTGKPWKMVNGVPTGDSGKSGLKLTFYGSRVDLIAGQIPKSEKTGTARILIDGKPVESNKSLYAITRPGPGPKTWFPLIRRISYNRPLIPETWTLTIDKVNADSTVWNFSVKGSQTGFDGSGNSEESFVSKSGRVVIDQSDYQFADIKKTFKIATPVGFEASWTVIPLFQSTYTALETSDKTKVYKTTLVQGLENGSHTLELIPLGDGPVPVEAFEIHRPPMQ